MYRTFYYKRYNYPEQTWAISDKSFERRNAVVNNQTY